jgi:hypothetical protein
LKKAALVQKGHTVGKCERIRLFVRDYYHCEEETPPQQGQLHEKFPSGGGIEVGERLVEEKD